MDEVRRLRQELDSLRSQLNWQNNEAERARRRLEDQNRAALQKAQADMQRALREHDEKARLEYERLLKDYQKSLNGELDAEMRKMDASYRTLKESTERTEKELRRKTQELEQAVKAIKNQNDKREQGTSREAAGYLKEAVSTFQSTEKKPHAKFVPGRLKIYYDELNDAKSLYDAKLFEAAAAVAISTNTGLERLGFQIEEAEHEWRGLYDLFVLRVDYLYTKIDHYLNEWHKFVGGFGTVGNKRPFRLAELNFWSRGGYEKIVSSMLGYKRVADHIRSKGVENYLLDDTGIDTENLKKFIHELEILENELDSLMPLCYARYTASCQRTELAELIIHFLEDEINLIWHDEESGFKKVTDEELSSKNFSKYITLCLEDSSIREDMREWLRLVFENSMGNRIYIYIIPNENHSVVKNRITVYIDYQGMSQNLYTRDICAHICEAVGVPFDEKNDGTGLVTALQDIEAMKQSQTPVIRNMAGDIEILKSGGQKL